MQNPNDFIFKKHGWLIFKELSEMDSSDEEIRESDFIEIDSLIDTEKYNE